MSCPALIDPACIVPVLAGHSAGAITGGVIGGIAHAVQSAIGWQVSSTVTWWVQIPSPDLAAEPTVGALQHWLLPVTVAVAVGAMLIAAGKIALTRKANPLMDVGVGLVVIAATSAVGVLLPSLLLRAGDAWSSWVLTTSTGGQFGSRLTDVLALPATQPVVVIVLGIVAIIMTTIQAVLMLFRQAALVVLAGVLPLAAAGTLAPATRAWFRRTTGWMLALIFYKPAAAAVYATAFTMIGRGKDPRIVLMGFAMVLLSLLALPVLMKFFTWTTGSVEASAGGGLLGTMLSGAIAVGALRGSSGGSGDSSAAGQARLMSAQLGPQGTGGMDGTSGPQGSPAGGLAGSSGFQATSPAPAGGAAAGPGSAAGTGYSPAAAGAAGGGASGGVAAGGAGVAGGAAAGGAAAGAGTAMAAGAVAGPAGAAAAAAAQGAARAARGAAQAMGAERTEE